MSLEVAAAARALTPNLERRLRFEPRTMQLVDFLGLLAVLLGHEVLWVSLTNRAHSFRFSIRILETLEKLAALAVLAGPVAATTAVVLGLRGRLDPRDFLFSHPAFTVYAFVCVGVGSIVATKWTWQRLTTRPPAQLEDAQTIRIDVAQELPSRPIGCWTTRLLDQIPANQMFELYEHRRTFWLETLPVGLDGLTIAHLSDLHLTGKISQTYFAAVVERTQQLRADLIVLTGDLVEDPACLDWLPTTFGTLRARLGCYFVLGNHDLHLAQHHNLRQHWTDLGWRDLGGQVHELFERGERLWLAGNEWPWFAPRPDLSRTLETSTTGHQRPFRILLSHSPDQLPWARQHQFDLMLAGHTHGGQVRFPFLGPVVAPSTYGTRYASGTFYERPTLMHVSRGISALFPLRMNCPPELSLLTLRVPVADPVSKQS